MAAMHAPPCTCTLYMCLAHTKPHKHRAAFLRLLIQITCKSGHHNRSKKSRLPGGKGGDQPPLRCREGGDRNSTGLVGRSTESWLEDRPFCLHARAAVLEVPPDGPVPRRFPETQKCALAGSQGLVPRPGGSGNGPRCHCLTL